MSLQLVTLLLVAIMMAEPGSSAVLHTPTERQVSEGVLYDFVDCIVGAADTSP
jgi:hypothetical protein